MRALVCISLLVLSGCATAGEGVRSAQDRSELTREDIERAGYRNALELVQTERPHWLRSRGRTSLMYEAELVVYLDGVRLGGPATLGQIHPIDIQTIRYYDSREAQYRFGVGHTQGALEIVSRR
jgi:hypothetical protein